MYKFGAQRSGLGQSTDEGQSHSSGREGPEHVQNEKRPRKDSREQQCITDRVRRGGGRLGVGKQWVEKQESSVKVSKQEGHLGRRSAWGR